MDIIYYLFGLIAALFVIWYVWKKIPTKSIEEVDQNNLAPYKVETPMVVTNTITDSIPPVDTSVVTSVPELKVVSGSSTRNNRKTVKKTPAKKPVAKKAVAKPADKSVAKPAAKPRAKKPTDTV